jgi:hypothetical protein
VSSDSLSKGVANLELTVHVLCTATSITLGEDSITLTRVGVLPNEPIHCSQSAAHIWTLSMQPRSRVIQESLKGASVVHDVSVLCL